MPTPRGRIVRRLTALGTVAALVAVLVSATMASGADGSWDLAAPNLSLSSSNLLGAAPRGIVFDVGADTPVAAFGIRARFDTSTMLTVEVREVTGRTPADVVLASGSLAVDAGSLAFRDVPVPPTTLVAGHRYDVRFQVSGGWGLLGPNWVEQQAFDNRDFNSAKFFTPDPPFTVVAGGGGFDATYTYAWGSLPHVHVVGGALDADPPVLDVRPSVADGAAATGWYNAATSGTDGVTLEVTTSDASPLKWVRCRDGSQSVLDTTLTVATIHLDDGFHSVTCEASDTNGNVGATDAPASVRVDQTAPTLAPFVNPDPVRQGQPAEAFARAADRFGVADAGCDTVSTRDVGRHVVACHAADPAGNDASASVEYDVVHAFDGFFSPVRMDGANRARAGSSVPLKFSIGEYDGLDILAAGSPSVAVCDATGAGSAAAGRLSYDADADLYVYVWKTDRAWAGSCREVTVRLDDGSAKSVRFTMT